MGEQAKPSRKIENSQRTSGWASEIIKRLLWVVIRRYDGSFSRRCSLDTKLLVCINASIRESLRRSKWEVDSIVAQSTEAWKCWPTNQCTWDDTAESVIYANRCIYYVFFRSFHSIIGLVVKFPLAMREPRVRYDTLLRFLTIIPNDAVSFAMRTKIIPTVHSRMEIIFLLG